MPDPLYSGRYTQAFAVTTSDTTTIQGPLQANGNALPYCKGFLALTAGNVVAQFQDDRANAVVTFPVLAGTVYPFSLSYFYTTSTATILGLL